jgi:hypothetical protein
MMWEMFRDVVVGVSRDPKVVATARMVLLYALPLLIEAGASHLAGWGVASPQYAGMATMTTLAMRAIGESVIDVLKKQKLGIGNRPDATG